ncbi:helix-turn-helix domain-containing protein [Streptosporangium amethystogenes subsp. fukuiense]|uniref:Helix-turn-helix domain-containing protein n=1 Tax=Streptosporangium amethystogenes subsp. fukuiense TaxID=698418 RepID=A0ABW2T6K5_9ACTN
MTNHKGPAAAFTQRIDQERRLKGWNIGELAARSGVGRNTITRMPETIRLPRASTVTALANAVGLDLHEAFKLAGYDGIPNPTPQQLAEQQSRSTMADALRARLPGLDDATLARVALAMADVMQGVASELFETCEEDR